MPAYPASSTQRWPDQPAVTRDCPSGSIASLPLIGPLVRPFRLRSHPRLDGPTPFLHMRGPRREHGTASRVVSPHAWSRAHAAERERPGRRSDCAGTRIGRGGTIVTELLMGVETEYALVAMSPRGERIEQDDL